MQVHIFAKYIVYTITLIDQVLLDYCVHYRL